MKEIILIGGGGHCKSVIDVIEQEKMFEIVGIVDKKNLIDSDVLGYPIIGSDSDFESLAKKFSYALITVGQVRSPTLRISLFDAVKKAGFILPKIISSKAYVSKHSSIGIGTIVMHNAIINAGASVGENCIINSKALIEHDSKISNHCHISTNAIINGDVTVGEGSFIGSGAITNNSILIKKNSFIKAGTVFK
jgi:sugar O-acyltransferase (sialic acid O-acetyltransferase NeuD family)